MSRTEERSFGKPLINKFTVFYQHFARVARVSVEVLITLVAEKVVGEVMRYGFCYGYEILGVVYEYVIKLNNARIIARRNETEISVKIVYQIEIAA